MKRLSWKYIAGLIDGEGCIDFQCHTYEGKDGKGLHIVPRLRIAMTDVALYLLEMLKANFGGNIWASHRNWTNPNWRPAYYWQLTGRGMRPLLQNIINHLILKREQAKFCIWWIDKCMGKHLDRTESEKIMSIRECARNELKAMKTDPHRLSERAIQEFSELMR